MDNIKLEYAVLIIIGDEQYYADSCEVFMDEHNIQWVKFIAKNGYHRDREHMVRTDRAMIVRKEA